MSSIVEQRNAEYKTYVDQFLTEFYNEFSEEPQQKLFEAVNYSLHAGGKRLRPALVFEFCRICGGDLLKAAPLAAAIEMIHTYSLIHDDLPCMDDDDLRRGKPTNHKVFGEAMAVLAGDALLTDAFGAALCSNIDGTNLLKAIGALTTCAGSGGMVGGQVLDIMGEERELSEDDIIDIYSKKTGALIMCACMCGALAGDCTEEQLDAATKFGGILGVAFQIRDDMLDVIGTEEEMGKGVGTDEKKNTLVRLWGLERCEELVKSYSDMAIETIGIFEDTDYLVALVKSLTDRRN